MTRKSLVVIIILTLIGSYMIAWDRTKGTQNRLNKAIMLSFRGHHEEALELFEKVLDRWPRASLALNGRGICLLNLGRYDEALASFDSILELDPLSLGALQGKGFSYEGLGRYDEAIQCFERIQEIKPDVLQAQEQIDKLIEKNSEHNPDP